MKRYADRSIPAWSTVTAGAFHTCALDPGNALWCWGSNSQGQLGNGIFAADAYAPLLVGSPATWSSVDGGDLHTCAIQQDNSLWCWGANSLGQLGDGTTTDRSTPVNIPKPDSSGGGGSGGSAGSGGAGGAGQGGASGSAGSGGSVATSVAPGQSSYAQGASLEAVCAGLPGNDLDWVGVFVPGADVNTRVAWAYTGGITGGSLWFPGVDPGTYEMRAYLNNSTQLLATSASFTVNALGTTIQPSQPSFSEGQELGAVVSNLPGNDLDWVGVFVPGADVNTRVAWAYTGGISSGSISFPSVDPGTYEMRAYLNNSTQLLATSAPFSVNTLSTSIQPSQPAYSEGQELWATVSGLPGNDLDWVGIFVPGADVNTRVAWAYTGGVTDGSLWFAGLNPGTYELRAYLNNSAQLLATSASFTVNALGATVQPSQLTYLAGQNVVANVASLPGNYLDWVGVFVPGADVNTRVAWAYTGGMISGSVQFPGVPAGDYELRVYLNNSTLLLSTSSAFSVTGP